jgi:deoxyribonuclease-4
MTDISRREQGASSKDISLEKLRSIILFLIHNLNQVDFGAHVSAAGGVANAPKNASVLGCECFQFFSQSPRGGTRKLPSAEEATAFKKTVVDLGLKSSYIHAPYFINLASKNGRIYYGSIEALKKELEIADMLGVRGVVTHLGSAKDYAVVDGEGEGVRAQRDKGPRGPIKQHRATSGLGRPATSGNVGSGTAGMPSEAAERIVKALIEIEKARTGKSRLILENAAGAGRILGSNLEQLAFLLKAVPGLGGICLDTAHAFASGLELRGDKAIDELVRKIKGLIGFDKLWVVHANDSLVDFDSHCDRHAHLGEGRIGKEAFGKLVRRREFSKVDFILETPTIEGMVRDLEMLHRFRD